MDELMPEVGLQRTVIDGLGWTQLGRETLALPCIKGIQFAFCRSLGW